MRTRSVRCARPQRSGFTLLELLLVLAILVMVVGIVGVNLGSAQTDANIKATTTQLANIKQAVQMFRIRMGTLPESLDALRDGPTDAAKKAKWTGPILDEIPKDAWENDFTFSVSGNSYELRSNGADGQANTDDDITVSGT